MIGFARASSSSFTPSFQHGSWPACLYGEGMAIVSKVVNKAGKPKWSRGFVGRVERLSCGWGGETIPEEEGVGDGDGLV